MSTVELANAYAALILADSNIDVTPDRLSTLTKAAKIEDIESIWTTLFVKTLEGKTLRDGKIELG